MAQNDRTVVEPRRASPIGAYVAILGIIILNISPFLDWLTTDGGDGDSFNGYESDSLVPFMAYLGVGFAAALLYALARAYRRQHRGLSLASMAVGIAATLQAIAYAVEPPGQLERGDNLSVEIGVYVALIGAALWAVGSGLLAKEPEGDPVRDDVVYRGGRSTTA